MQINEIYYGFVILLGNLNFVFIINFGGRQSPLKYWSFGAADCRAAGAGVIRTDSSLATFYTNDKLP